MTTIPNDSRIIEFAKNLQESGDFIGVLIPGVGPREVKVLNVVRDSITIQEKFNPLRKYMIHYTQFAAVV